MSETGDYLRGIFNGEIPVKRKMFITSMMMTVKN